MATRRTNASKVSKEGKRADAERAADDQRKKARIAWIRAKHQKAVDDHNFANGFRAGLQCALLALDGRDILGNSID